jgi:hypothetical protein
VCVPDLFGGSIAPVAARWHDCGERVEVETDNGLKGLGSGTEDAGLGRLAYDALRWHASKLVPKVYGDKAEVALTGSNGGPVQSENVTVRCRSMTRLRPRGYTRS